jgi:hypothetical protein
MEVPTLVISWQPLLCWKLKSSAWLKRHLIAVLPSRKLGATTAQDVCRMVAEMCPKLICVDLAWLVFALPWSAARCTELFNGFEVSGGRIVRGVLTSYKGDWQWKVKSLLLDRYYNCRLICHRCLASRGQPYPFDDLRWSAAWFATDKMLPAWPEAPAPTITAIPGFSAETDRWDLLHVWHLGIGQTVAGSTIVADLDPRFASCLVQTRFRFRCLINFRFTFRFRFRLRCTSSHETLHVTSDYCLIRDMVSSSEALLLRQNYWAGNNEPARLANAWADFLRWCKMKNTKPRMTGFSLGPRCRVLGNCA